MRNCSFDIFSSVKWSHHKVTPLLFLKSVFGKGKCRETYSLVIFIFIPVMLISRIVRTYHFAKACIKLCT